MSVFISWSESLSKDLAQAFSSWLSDFFDIDVYFSERNIDLGSPWFKEMSNALKSRNIGLFFITKESLNSSWMIFEAGSIFKGNENSKICPILFDLERVDIDNTPYKHFQSFYFKKDQIFNLLRLINKNRENKIPEKIIEDQFNSKWPEFKAKISLILSNNNNKDNISMNEAFDSDYAINNKNLKYLYENIILKRIALIASNSEAKINIIDYYENENCFKIETSISSIIHNMHKNKSINDSLAISVCPDKITPSPTESLGGVLSINISDEENIIHQTEEEISILGDYERKINFTVKPNGKIKYEHHFWILNKANDKYYTFFQRFSESANVTVHNKLEDFDIIIKYESNETLIKPGKALKIYNGAILPEQYVTFLIMSPRRSITTIQ